jgi:hypothetical protein
VIRLGELACRLEAIQGIDVNPLRVVQGEPDSVDAGIVLKIPDLDT